jgi:hypothetical protein
MQFNAKDDFVTENEIIEEQEQLIEETRMTEEDTGYDNHNQFNGPVKPIIKDIEECTPDIGDTDENFGEKGQLGIFEDEPEEDSE